MQRKSSKKHRTQQFTQARRYIYVVLFFIAAATLCYAIIDKHSLIPDTLFSIAALSFLLCFDRRNHLSTAAVLLVAMTISLNIAGLLGLYSKFVIGSIGYDKVIHFVNCFSGVYILLEILKEKNTLRKFIFAVLIVMGISALGEINEFIGTRYFGVNTGGIFAQGQELPVINDLIRYDTYFDLIFDLAGALSCAIVMAVFRKKKNKFS